MTASEEIRPKTDKTDQVVGRPKGDPDPQAPGPQADTREGQQKGPSRQVGDVRRLRAGEGPSGGRARDQQEPDDELRELLPQKRRFVFDLRGAALAHPVQRVAEHDEPDRGIAGGLREHRELPGGIRIESAGGDASAVLSTARPTQRP